MTSENCWVMYDIEATVTTATPTELKLTASWPLDWLQAPNSIEIQRKLSRMKRWSLHQDPFSEWKLAAIEDFGVAWYLT
jgi:hypothetical protein